MIRLLFQGMIAAFFLCGLVSWVTGSISTEKMDWIMTQSLLLQILLEINELKK